MTSLTSKPTRVHGVKFHALKTFMASLIFLHGANAFSSLSCNLSILVNLIIILFRLSAVNVCVKDHSSAVGTLTLCRLRIVGDIMRIGKRALT